MMQCGWKLIGIICLTFVSCLDLYLQKEGYAIEAVNNKGYILKMAPDVLSGVYIEEHLKKAQEIKDAGNWIW